MLSPRATVDSMTAVNTLPSPTTQSPNLADIHAWHPADTLKDRSRAGIQVRKTVAIEDHARFTVSDDRRSVIGLLEEQSAQRVKDLIPLRYSRMDKSAFTFYRGTALIMANDLARTPITGIPVQCVGDAHIGNFGMFLSPSRRLVFDINDFDETLTGPWEWDVKRLAASVEICGRTNGIKPGQVHDAVKRCMRTYRERIQRFADMDYLDVWYDHLDVEATLDRFETVNGSKRNRTLREAAMKATLKDSDRAAQKLTYVDGNKLRFRSAPPELVPLGELDGYDLDALQVQIATLFERYRHSLYEDRRHIFEHYHLEDCARKVVGVGSVGTRAWVGAFTGRDIDDPLMLQMKEANESVLERFVGKSPYPTHGERMVQGQKLIQSTSDVLLGWSHFTGLDGESRDYYVRQLWDGKGSIDIDHLNATALSDLARMCAWCLAHAHARTGDSMAIGSYLGGTEEFEDALASFAETYADQNDIDYELFTSLLKSGELLH